MGSPNPVKRSNPRCKLEGLTCDDCRRLVASGLDQLNGGRAIGRVAPEKTHGTDVVGVRITSPNRKLRQIVIGSRAVKGVITGSVPPWGTIMDVDFFVLLEI